MFILEARVITISSTYHMLQGVISFNPQLPDYPIGDHSLLSPGYSLQRILSPSTVILFACFFPAYHLPSVCNLSSSGQEASLILSYIPLLSQRQAQSTPQTFSKRTEELRGNPSTYLSYTWKILAPLSFFLLPKCLKYLYEADLHNLAAFLLTMRLVSVPASLSKQQDLSLPRV